MLKNTKWFFLGILSTILIGNQETFAQSSASIYSALGIGDFNYSGLTHNQAMGGTGISFGTGWNPNFVNPALQTRNTIFNFQAALNYKRIDVSNGTESSGVDGGGLSYLALSLPFKPGKIGLGMGLNQLSSVNYDLELTSQVSGTDLTSFNSIEGNGGISETYLSVGFLAAKNLSFGIHGSYFFGSTIRTNLLEIFTPNGVTVGSRSEYYERLTISDVGVKFGGHYFFPVNETANLHIGGIYQALGDLNGRGYAKIAGENQASNPDSPGDLIANDIKGSVRVPSRYGLGISYEKKLNYVISLEGQFQDFTAYRNFFDEQLQLRESMNLALGFQITPDFNSIDNVLKRSTYRVGLEYQQTPYFLNQTKINDIGINFGASIPVNQLSILNFALKLGQRGTTETGLVRENYVNFSLGFSLNDNSWFYKRVFD